MATATIRKPRVLHLIEERFFGPSAGADALDEVKGVLKGVKILGTESANGAPPSERMTGVTHRIYSPEALTKGASLYEGKKVYWDHPDKPGQSRKTGDHFGRIVNVKGKPDGLYGDFEYKTSHPRAKEFVEMVKRWPGDIGFSPHHFVVGEKRGDAYLITEIGDVRSVDLVDEPATTKGLFESRDIHMKKTLKAILEEKLGKPKFLAHLKAVLEADPAMGDMGMEPIPDDNDGDVDADYRTHLLAAVASLLDSTDPEDAKVVDALMKLLKPKPAAAPAPAKEGEMTPEEKAAAAKESKDGAALKREVLGLKLCMESGISLKGPRLKAFLALTEEADMKAFLEEEKHQERPARGARSASQGSSVTESKEIKIPTDLAGYKSLVLA